MNESAATRDPSSESTYDLAIIGGGVNGCGIARDAAGRGLRVYLCEMGDLAEATSSASTKLFHGGLRYLEYFEFRLVREALIERENLLTAMPHISWPMRFVLPIDKNLAYENDNSTFGKFLGATMPFLKGKRPAWITRIGLFLYDHLGGRKILPPTKVINLATHKVGTPLKDEFVKAFEYSDCWVQDSRLVVLNARDAVNLGATVETRTKFIGAEHENGLWQLRVQNQNEEEGATTTKTVRAKAIVNAGGPWVEDIAHARMGQNGPKSIRLVRGSHIVTKKLFDHDQPYFLQLRDGRIIFAIPYEEDFTLIGTTDHDHDAELGEVKCTDEERDYLLSAANQFFKKQLGVEDIVWTYSGVRPLYDDNASDATAATRDYVLDLKEHSDIPPLLNVYGGKITTYRKLAEEALTKLGTFFPQMGKQWTARAPLPGGEFAVSGVRDLTKNISETYPFLDHNWVSRLLKTHGTDTFEVLGKAQSTQDLGIHFGADLYEKEVRWLMKQEFAQTAADIVWRRTRIGLRLSKAEIATLDKFMLSARTSEKKEQEQSVG